MAKREKKAIITDVTREAMVEAFGAYAAAAARMGEITAELETEIVKLREAVAPELAKLTTTKEGAAAKIEAFAMEHRSDLFAKTKSMKTVHGVLGFRTATPKAKPRKGFTWASVLELLKVKAPDYIRTIEEVDRARIIADRESEEFAAIMPSIGVEVTQDETFYIEPKSEDTEQKK